ncbi:MAG: Xaa-Pro peptidase family protein [Acidobacteriaceae bacterium]
MRERARRKKAVQAALKAGADGLVVTHGPDVRYLSGFTGSSGAVALVGGRAALFTDGRYTAQAKSEAEGVRVVIDKRPPAAQAVEWLAAAGVKKCAFDAGQTTVAALDGMKKALPGALRRRFLVATDGLVARIRQVKDEDEIARMRKAAALGCGLFGTVLQYIVAGAEEAQVAAQLEFLARLAGAEAMSFETIVASGERSALPHGRATSAKLPSHGFVTLDFGVVLDGYCSDMTRTAHLGGASGREWDVYHSVLEAQQAAIAAVAPGVTCGEVDEAARSVLRAAGLEKEFSHSTGHGVGLEIHEGPRVAAKQTQVLEPGMVITIEPGAYLSSVAAEGKRKSGSRAKGVHPVPKAFGVRIEDMVLVTESGCEVLTAASSKDWIEL